MPPEARHARRNALGTALKPPCTGCRAQYLVCLKLAVGARDAVARKRGRDSVREDATCHEKDNECWRQDENECFAG